MTRLTIIISLFFFSLVYTVAGESVKSKELVGGDVQFLMDAERRLTLDDIPEQSFEKISGGVPNFGFYDGVVWLKFQVPPDIGTDYTLELKNPNLDQIELFLGTGGGSDFIKHSSTGDYYPFSERRPSHRFFHFPVKRMSGDIQEILIRIDNHGDQLYIPIAVWKASALVERDYNEQYLFGIYYGMLIFVFFLNLFIFIVIRERANGYYLSYLASLILLQLGLGGHGAQYFWGESMYWSNNLQPIMASLSIWFTIKFAQHFLNTRQFIPRFNKVFEVMAFVVFLNFIMACFDNETTLMLSIITINGVTLVLTLIIIPTAVYVLKQKFKPARFFLLAFVVLVISVAAFILRNFGLAPSHFLTDYSLQIGSSIEVILLSFAVVDKFKMFKEEAVNRLEEMNQLKSEQNIILEEQVAARTEELSTKNREIVDSITYAKRIQNAILPPMDIIEKSLKGSFVLYLPKDIVAGDFYWMEKVKDKIMFAVADCTGHGVPGAMVSVVCNNALNRAIREYQLVEPAAILDKVTDIVIETFDKGDEAVKDGMDVSLCTLDLTSGALEFSGANNSLYVVSGSELNEIKGNKQPVGKYMERKPFTNHEVDVKPGDRIYLFSDGYADQFGGPKGKKFKYAPFKQLLLDNAGKPPDEQLQLIQKNFSSWMGDLEQVDDVCLFSVAM